MRTSAVNLPTDCLCESASGRFVKQLRHPYMLTFDNNPIEVWRHDGHTVSMKAAHL